MDGYAVEKITKLRWPKMLLSMPDGIWTLDVGGLQVLRGQTWQPYPIPEMAHVEPLDLAHIRLRRFGNHVLGPWFKSQITPKCSVTS